jgi:hypothetical protein
MDDAGGSKGVMDLSRILYSILESQPLTVFHHRSLTLAMNFMHYFYSNHNCVFPSPCFVRPIKDEMRAVRVRANAGQAILQASYASGELYRPIFRVFPEIIPAEYVEGWIERLALK